MQRTPHTPEARMIKPQDKVFANLTHHLHRDLPREPLTRLVNLAAVAVGILRSKSLQVGQIVTASPLAGQCHAVKRWCVVHSGGTTLGGRGSGLGAETAARAGGGWDWF